MLNFVATTLAVPYGYTKDLENMGDSDNQCFVINNNRWNTSSSGVALPDIIMDATVSPPSPLRRSHSYHFLFPVKKHIDPYPEVSSLVSSSPDVVESCTRVHPNEMPSLSWDAQEKKDRRLNQNDTEEHKKWKSVGDDLKKIADKFDIDHSKIRCKNKNISVDTLNLASIPVATVTRCLQAGIVTLLCWRLLNKLR
ncbi:unnamed protein product [Meganyctiphanes norvegica]|uniref:LysM domain-containing protein n=1 Tax=Meganyctiphanes norvegica TaxID=48144 RepID=A0AAV2S1W6_MEGNR